MPRTICVALALVIALGGRVRAADNASPSAQADELVRRALDRRRQGDNVGAVGLLRQAEELAPSARISAQLGFAEFALQHWVEAETWLERTLTGPESSWLATAKNREMLDKTLAETKRHVAQIEVTGTPGAQISVNGQSAGVLPMTAPIHVAAGSVRLTATAPGRQRWERTLTVSGGEPADVRADLEPIASLAPPQAIGAPDLAPARPGPSSVPPWRRWTGAGLLAGGVAAVGAGIVWVALDGRTSCSPPAGGVCDRVYNTKTQGWISIAAGAVAAGAGATLFVWRRTVSTTVAIGPGILSLGGRF